MENTYTEDQNQALIALKQLKTEFGNIMEESRNAFLIADAQFKAMVIALDRMQDRFDQLNAAAAKKAQKC